MDRESPFTYLDNLEIKTTRINSWINSLSVHGNEALEREILRNSRPEVYGPLDSPGVYGRLGTDYATLDSQYNDGWLNTTALEYRSPVPLDG